MSGVRSSAVLFMLVMVLVVMRVMMLAVLRAASCSSW